VKLPPEVESRVRSWVIHQDQDIIVLNKPPGIPVQGSEDSIATLLSALTYGNDDLPHIVHRLDKNTSGILLLARSPDVAKRLSEAFRCQKIFKMYWAITIGKPPNKKGTIRATLSSKQNPEREGTVLIQKDGKPGGLISSTSYHLLETFGAADVDAPTISLLALQPHTGRTHQLRVHCASVLETPIVGDFKYGSGYPPGLQTLIEDVNQMEGLCLHAQEMCLHHPVTQVPLRIRATLPLHMAKLFNAVGWSKKQQENKKAWLPELTVQPLSHKKRAPKKPAPVTPKILLPNSPKSAKKHKSPNPKATTPKDFKTTQKKGKLK